MIALEGVSRAPRGAAGPCERCACVVVASYDRVRIDAASLARIEWGLAVVLDEAQYIKNHATKTTRAVKRLRSRLRFALTGTPVENRLSELWSIFDFLMPGFLGSYERFRERYELGIIGEDEEAAARLRALIEPFVLRRRKADVLTDLPAKFEGISAICPFPRAAAALRRRRATLARGI